LLAAERSGATTVAPSCRKRCTMPVPTVPAHAAGASC
jgi:hypothetical protein